VKRVTVSLDEYQDIHELFGNGMPCGKKQSFSFCLQSGLNLDVAWLVYLQYVKCHYFFTRCQHYNTNKPVIFGDEPDFNTVSL